MGKAAIVGLYWGEVPAQENNSLLTGHLLLRNGECFNFLGFCELGALHLYFAPIRYSLCCTDTSIKEAYPHICIYLIRHGYLPDASISEPKKL